MKIIPFLLFLAVFLLPLPSYAFNPDYIISDADLDNYNSMTLEDIKKFLSDNKSYLQYYADFYPETGLYMESAEIIWRVAQKFYINPQVLLTFLEKEQSLITMKKPTQKRLDWAMGYAVCDRCRLKHPLVIKYKGLGKQIYSAAERIRTIYLRDLDAKGVTQTKIGPGITRVIDKKYKVTPVNKATALLYTYTPHITGNKNFFNIWNKWFSNMKYPDGALLQDAISGGIYLIQNGQKRPFASKAAFVSRYPDASKVVQVSRIVLNKYENGPAIKFTDYSLLRDENGTIYMTVGDEARPFDSYEVFKSIGFSPFEVEDIVAGDLAGYAIGKPITEKNAYPTGALLQDSKTGGVYWVYDGTKHAVMDKAVLKARFGKMASIKVSAGELAKYETGEPVKYGEGELLRSAENPTVYLVSGGKLRPVPSEEIFEAYNWNWKNVITTNEKMLALYETSRPLSLDKNNEEEPTEEIATVPAALESPTSTPETTIVQTNI